MARDEAGTEQIRVLQAVLVATNQIEAALFPLDVEALQLAVTAREQSLQRLEGALTPLPPDPLRRAMQDLSDEIEAKESRNRALSQLALASIREELRGIQTGRQALSVYALSPEREPRFADRRG